MTYSNNLAMIIIVFLFANGVKADNVPETGEVRGPFTPHFAKWLEKNGHAKYDFASNGLGAQASYGGKAFHRQRVNRRPVVFIHGNSDGALADGSEEWAQGWSASIKHLIGKGYSSGELYAITYGDRNLANSLTRSVDCTTLLRLRRFVESVLEYTRMPQIDIVAHSMGVTLARKLIQGAIKSAESDESEECQLGQPLRKQVHTLIGIAGANYGLCLCANPEFARNSPACGKETGFWTGSGCPEAHPDECSMETPTVHRADCHTSGQYSAILRQLNSTEQEKDAHFVVSMWSSGDAVLGHSNLAWGRRTSLISRSDNSHIYSESHSHYSIKWLTVHDQFTFLATAELHSGGRK